MTGYSDWETEVTEFKGDNRVPESCCKGLVADDKVDSCKKSPGDVEQPSKLKGCWTKFNDNVKKHRSTILGVSITILLLMVSYASLLWDC